METTRPVGYVCTTLTNLEAELENNLDSLGLASCGRVSERLQC